MKRFNEFVNENNSDKTFEDFLEEVKDALMHDFKNSKEQAKQFVEQYFEVLEDSWKNGYTVREAIASTKIPGVKVSDGKVAESYLFEIDNDFEKAYETIENINSNQLLMEGEDVIDNYYKKYYKKNFSDNRIFERVKNNYNSLKNLYNKKLNN
jgi:hypothetical protein